MLSTLGMLSMHHMLSRHKGMCCTDTRDAAGCFAHPGSDTPDAAGCSAHPGSDTHDAAGYTTQMGAQENQASQCVAL